MMSKFFRAQVWAVTIVACAAIAGTLAAQNHSAATTSEKEEKCVIVVSPRTDGKAVIAPALEQARPGCTIHLRSGLYKEIITISKPISLVGEAGVVLDPSEPLTAKWVRAEGYGNGVYRATVEQEPASLLLDGKFLAQVNPVRPETQPGKPWDWKRLLADGPPRTGFRMIKGLWLYLPSEKAIFVHLENNVDPSQLSWSAIWSKEPIITIKDTKDASVRDVTLAHGFNAITITGKCLRCSVTHSTIGPLG